MSEQDDSEQISATGTETILIVDDEEDLAHVAENYLSEAGYTTLLAYSGEEAIELLKQRSASIDLVMSDIVMSGKINGFILADQVLRKWPSVRMTLTSGFVSNVGKNLIKKSPVSNHLSRTLLQKPYTENALLQHVREVLDEKKLLEWSDQYSMGIPAIDDDHKMLVSLLNHVYAAFLAGKPDGDFLDLLEQLSRYTTHHFLREEKVMEVCAYPDIEKHRKAHKVLLNEVSKYLKQAYSGLTSEQKEGILKFFYDEVIDHIAGMDMEINKYVSGKEKLIQSALDSLVIKSEKP